MVLGLQPFTGVLQGGAPPLDTEAGEELVRTEHGAAVALGNRQPESPGTLFITTRKLIWVSNTEGGKGYEVDFPSIALHAVSRDPEAFPLPCIYAQIETDVEGIEEFEEAESQDEELELSKVTEMRIIPSDSNQLDAIFDVFCQCAEMNPDMNSESEEENSCMYGDEEMPDGIECEYSPMDHVAHSIGQTNGDHELVHSVVELSLNDQRFEDAEESENESRGNGH